MQDELGETGFTVLGVALDNGPEDVQPWVEGITFPVLIDPQHLLTELYAISNVPTVVWIDEEGRIVRPNGVAFGSDQFKQFTGVEAGPHLDALRRWVHSGELPLSSDQARGALRDLSTPEVLARLHFRVGAVAHGYGHEEAARRHFAAGAALAPDDFTVLRAAMPLQGQDPFGPEFLAIWRAWQEAGSPYNGLQGTPGTP
jgi:hypothetical protein